MSNSCLVFFQREACNLDGAVAFLEKYRFSIVKKEDELFVTRGDSQEFKITLDSADYVNEEAREIAEGKEFSKELSLCDARFEIVIEDLDSALNEINTLMEVQGALQDACVGYLFTPWNGNVTQPWLG